MTRLGYIAISDERLREVISRQDPSELARWNAIFRDAIVLDITTRYETRMRQYLIYHPDLDPIDEYCEAPRYEVFVNKIPAQFVGGCEIETYKVTFTRI